MLISALWAVFLLEVKLILERELNLYAITDRKDKPLDKFLLDVKAALEGGVGLLQLREKKATYDEFLKIAREVKALCDSYKVGLIINDNVEIAKEVDAYGVHLGESDQDIEVARKLLGPDKIIGATAKNLERARSAQKAGANYLGCGDIFGTKSKSDAKRISIQTLKEICQSVEIPVIAIGGIDKDNIHELKDSGIVGVAVIGSIFHGDNVFENTRVMLSKSRNL